MSQPIRILLQTTLTYDADDWCIERFSLLTQYLKSLQDQDGNPLCEVTARDRQPDEQGNDPILSALDRTQFDELWLFALDIGGGLSRADCKGVVRFHQQGGGIFTTRDHQDMGISMAELEGLGSFHNFHSQNLDPDESRCSNDDCYTPYISFPNYHSGRNGDYQTIAPTEPLHDLLKTESGAIALFPAHPHEGSVTVPPGVDYAKVIATGTSRVTGRSFNLAVAAEPPQSVTGAYPGRIVAQSTFHHLVDYNWDIRQGCPTFVDEAPGDGMAEHPQALADIKAYVRNLVRWLTPSAD